MKKPLSPRVKWLIAANLALLCATAVILYTRMHNDSSDKAKVGAMAIKAHLYTQDEVDTIFSKDVDASLDLMEKVVGEMPQAKWGTPASIHWGARFSGFAIRYQKQKLVDSKQKQHILDIAKELIDKGGAVDNKVAEVNGIFLVGRYGHPQDVALVGPFLENQDPKIKKLATKVAEKLSREKA
jgi:hypothetical protein